DGMLYAIYVDLGSPFQTVGLILDTGSSDVWIKSSKSTSCIPYSYNSTTVEIYGTTYPHDCYYYGLFDPDSSSTFINNNTDFFLNYMTGFSNGTWAKDSFNLNGALIHNYTFGLSNYTNINPGVFGIGLIANQQTQNKYQNFPARLKDDNYIARNLYSLFLNEGLNATGNLLFGAIDHAKYTGSLKTFEVAKERSLMTADLVNIRFNNQTLTTVPAGALFDCGATEISFPDPVFDQLLSLLNIPEMYAIVDCNNKANEIITFDFDGFLFEIPVKALYYDNGDGTCTFVAGPMGATNQMSLGIEFMKYAYIVFDLDNRQISLGHPNYTTDKDIQVI
ncbi:secreted aspartic protease 1, partial [Ascoidea rubescens DSM 1968]